MDTATFNWMEFAYTGLPGIFSIVMGAYLIQLRISSAKSPTTQVQRWGMTFLAWLFLLNGIMNIIASSAVLKKTDLMDHIGYHISVLGPVMAIGFGAVFPRPLVRPGAFQRLLIVLAVLMALLVFLILGETWLPNKASWPYMFYPTLIAWAFVTIRWGRLYTKSADQPETAMITTALIWAFLFHLIVRYNLWRELLYLAGARPGASSSQGVLMVITAVVVVSMISVELYRRRGKWGVPEKVHAIFIASTFLIFLMLWMMERPDGLYPDSGPFLLLHAPANQGLLMVMGIDIVRPALLFYALLRFQLFGRELRVERGITVLATITMAYYGALVVALFFSGSGPGTLTAVAATAFVILLYPVYQAAVWTVRRVIPKAREMSRQEARNVYYISFQGASYKGEITDPSDDEALAVLRLSLGVTDREHSLLLELERSRERAGRMTSRMRYALLLDDSGRLVAHVGPPEEVDMDKEILAGMLTAVSQFVRDAFKSKTGELDTLRYGDRTLVMEKGGGFILAVAIEGEGGPAVRTILGDILTILLHRHGNILFEWDGNITDAEPARNELQRIFDSYNVSGHI